MFPIRDHNPSGRTPYVVYALIAANAAVFLGQTGLMGDDRALAYFFYDWGVVPGRISSGQGYLTLVTSMFIHAGFFHIAGNMLFLWIFGDNLEDEMGHGGFLLFYLACGIGAGLIHVIVAPTSMVPTVGASGAIAGVMGGYLLLYPRARIDILLILIIFFRVFTVPAWVMLGVWFGFQLLGSLDANPDGGGIAYWAHTGGFVVGLLLTLPVWLRRGGAMFWGQTHGRPPHPGTEFELSPTRIPRIRRK